MDVRDYAGFVAKVIPLYLNLAVANAMFGRDMQRDVEEILDGKTVTDREPLTCEDKNFLTKLLKTLHSIDYTDRVGAPITEYPERSEWRRSRVGRSRAYEDKPEEASPAYDMEL